MDYGGLLRAAPPAAAPLAQVVPARTMQGAKRSGRLVAAAPSALQDPGCPTLLPPPPCRRPPPLRLQLHGSPLLPPQRNPHAWPPHALAQGTALHPEGHRQRTGTLCSAGLAAAVSPLGAAGVEIPPLMAAVTTSSHAPVYGMAQYGRTSLLPQPAARRALAAPVAAVSGVAVTGAGAGGSSSGGGGGAGSGSAAGPAGGAAAVSYELPAHWQDQMAKAPLGRKRVLQRYYADVIAINQLEPDMRALNNAQLRAKTAEFRRRLSDGESLQSLRVEAFAVVREASRRVLGMRHYDCQLVGGMVLAEGQVAEMQTGEGKTLVATLPGYLGALTGRGVHVVTVNDYLAARDAAWMGKLYRFLGLTCAAVQSNSSVAAARAAFAADVTYVTGQELGFCYLKDNTALSPQDLTLRDDRFHFAIVDEVDSILIDESRNPMIISGRGSCDTRVVQLVDRAVRRLWSQVQGEVAAELSSPRSWGMSDHERQRTEKAVKSRYYTIDEKSRTLSYTQTGTHFIFLYLLDEGATFSDPYPGVHSLWEEEVPWGRLAVTSLTAYELYINGKDYIVRDGEAVIVDSSTGRLRPKTRWQGGIHQAVEAKEGLAVQAENLVTATITFQLFFRQYEWLSGMTGTAQPAAAELFELYGIKVVPVPTNRPSRRRDHPPRLFYDKALKMHALANEVLLAAEQQRPVLIGTTSVQESELVLNYLTQTVYPSITAMAARRAAAARAAGPGVELASLGADAGGGGGFGLKPRITLLNAKPELVRLEAQVIAQAGLPGAVTIATNMAGRGTDIILGGNPEGLTKLALLRLIYRRLLPASERETLPQLPLLQLEPYDTDDIGALTRIPYATPEAPLAGLPRPLHEVLSTAILISFAAQPDDGSGGPSPAFSLFSAGAGAGGEIAGPLGTISGSISGSLGGSLDELGGGGGGPAGSSGISYGQTAELVTWVMDRAEVLRRKVRGALRRTYRSHQGGLESLNFTLCVAPTIARILAEREQQLLQDKQQQAAARQAAAASAFASSSGSIGGGGGFSDDDDVAAAAAAVVATSAPGAGDGEDEGEEPVAQVWALRAALHLWLWFDQECARYREEVRAAGGLLVVGTSLNDSARIELQLRGRAGRQGDPGETLMLLDCVDPLMVMFGMDRVSAMLNQLGSQLQCGPDYLEGGPVDYFVNYIVRWQESMFQNMRLETKKYDAVMEEYRRNLYTLRRLVLCGSDMQRAQIVYVLIQRYVDELVGRYLDPGQPPRRWLDESVRLDSLPGAPATPADQAPRLISPLQAVLHCLRTLVNPPGRTTKTLVDFAEVSEAAANPTVRKLLELFGVAKSGPAGSGGAAGGQAAGGAGGDPSYLPVYMQVEELEVLSPDQLRNLAEYIAGTGPLQWPVPAAREIRGNFKLQLQLLTHRKIFGYGAAPGSFERAAPPTAAAAGAAASGEGSGGAAPASSTAAAGEAAAVGSQPGGGETMRMQQLGRVSGLMQRPPLFGPFAEKVAVLRSYLGEILITCYESRRLASRLTLTASPSLGFTDIDAEQQVCAVEQQTMLLWLDALWSCFLEDTTRLRNAVNIRSTNGSNPVAEFRIEANAAFLALLDNYRDAVLDKLLVPDFSIYTPMGDEYADTDLIGGAGERASSSQARAADADSRSSAHTSSGNGNGNGDGSDVPAAADSPAASSRNGAGGNVGSDSGSNGSSMAHSRSGGAGPTQAGGDGSAGGQAAWGGNGGRSGAAGPQEDAGGLLRLQRANTRAEE